MARTRRTITIDEKISRAQENVIKCKEKYDEAVAELASLQEQKAALQKKELISALETSTKSYAEIMAFLRAVSEE